MQRIFTPTLVLLMSLTACCPPPLRGNPELPYPPPRPPAIGDILHLPTGYYVNEAQLLDAAGDARIVYVGETHDNPASHRLELTILKGMADRHPSEVALGMEMFTPAQQPVLDRWVAGELNERDFLKESNWYQTWQMDFDYYRELLLFARDRHIPVLGLNAQKSLVHAVARTPFESLPEEQRAALPEFDQGDAYARQLNQAIFGGHDSGSAGMDGFNRVQLLWDETMAEHIARYLASPQGENQRLVVVAGSNHIRNGFGIPRRVFRRLPVSFLLIGSHEIEIGPDKQDRLMDVTIPDFPMPSYHYLVYTAYEDLDKQEVKLGVLLGEEEGKVRVRGVLPGSAAETAGIKEGDAILNIDGEQIKETFDLVYAIKQKRAGDRVILDLERDGEPLSLDVVLTLPTHGAK